MSNETPTREGLCVYCGTSRPVSKPICPQCGRTWIDTKVGEELPPLTPEIVAASVEEREALAAAQAEMQPPERRRPWGLILGAVFGLLAVVLILNVVLGDDGDPAATGTTTTTSGATATTPGPVTTTTAAATTTTPTTAPATTTSPTTTTTTTTTTIAPIEPEGEPVAIADLTLGAFALGPFPFDASTSYLGRLVASLGQPDSLVAAGPEHGLCENVAGKAYTWGALTAVFETVGDEEILMGYLQRETATDHPTQAITTRSGLQLGHTVETLEAIYLQSGIAFEDLAGEPHFVLLRSTDNATLLWGPLSGTDPAGIIEGIYSPQACDGGPRPTT